MQPAPSPPEPPPPDGPATPPTEPPSPNPKARRPYVMMAAVLAVVSSGFQLMRHHQEQERAAAATVTAPSSDDDPLAIVGATPEELLCKRSTVVEGCDAYKKWAATSDCAVKDQVTKDLQKLLNSGSSQWMVGGLVRLQMETEKCCPAVAKR